MQAGFKKEYTDMLNGGTLPPEGSTTAHAALMRATLALDRIERHEEECKRRWGLVVRLMLVALTKLGGLTMFLVADKLGWLS